MNLLQSLQCLADAAGGLIRNPAVLPDLAKLGEAQLRTQKFIADYAHALRAMDTSKRFPRVRYQATVKAPFDQPRFDQLLKRAADHFGITVAMVLNRSRTFPLAYQRQLIQTTIIEIMGFPIRDYPFNRNHSGISHSMSLINSWRQIYPEVKADYEKLKAHLTAVSA